MYCTFTELIFFFFGLEMSTTFVSRSLCLHVYCMYLMLMFLSLIVPVCCVLRSLRLFVLWLGLGVCLVVACCPVMSCVLLCPVQRCANFGAPVSRFVVA